ncbi:MAG: hypothetical protein R3248_08180 [Candidatus Promineifilaceae bacterium]|nr:hypothetical protein [Candidatus Promineifilaceae bacterium]
MKKQNVLFVIILLVGGLIAVIPALADSPVHAVHAGGPDACEAWGLAPGCDANFSLVAIEHGDGSVTGQWSDQFGGGDGAHIAIDCLAVDGNQAWFSGLITQETISGTGAYVGLRVAARVVDNGTSANDPPDQISYITFDLGNTACAEQPEYQLFDVSQGQVRVD